MEFKFRGWVSGLLERLEPRPEIRLKRVDELPSPYRAVSIRAGATSCQAAKAFGKKRFLASRAPRFPLPECTCDSCDCTYVHHADRRSGIDRRRTLGEAPASGIIERRLSAGRRSSDAMGFNDPNAAR